LGNHPLAFYAYRQAFPINAVSIAQPAPSWRVQLEDVRQLIKELVRLKNVRSRLYKNVKIFQITICLFAILKCPVWFHSALCPGSKRVL